MGQEQFQNLSAYYRALPGMQRLSEFQKKITRLLRSGEAMYCYPGIEMQSSLCSFTWESLALNACCRHVVFLVSAVSVHLEGSL